MAELESIASKQPQPLPRPPVGPPRGSILPGGGSIRSLIPPTMLSSAGLCRLDIAGSTTTLLSYNISSLDSPKTQSSVLTFALIALPSAQSSSRFETRRARKRFRNVADWYDHRELRSCAWWQPRNPRRFRWGKHVGWRRGHTRRLPDYPLLMCGENQTGFRPTRSRVGIAGGGRTAPLMRRISTTAKDRCALTLVMSWTCDLVRVLRISVARRVRR
jgi:hypothetical protein